MAINQIQNFPKIERLLMTMPNASQPMPLTPMMRHVPSRRVDAISRQSHGAFLTLTSASLAAFLLWAGFAKIDIVTHGNGRVVPEQQDQFAQHLEGGIVTKIMVREGDRVERGAPLFKVRNGFQIAEREQAQLDKNARTIRILRLKAEAQNAESFDVPAALKAGVLTVLEREQGLFDHRRTGLMTEISILDDQIHQKELELSELKARWKSTQRERELVTQRYANLKKLSTIGAVSANEMLDNDRVLEQVESRLSDLLHEIPRAEATLAEMISRRNSAQIRFQTDAEKELSDNELQLSKLNEQIQALDERDARSEVTAPVSGIVNKLFFTTESGVVRPGERLAQIVPDDNALTVEAKISPADRAKIWPGQTAILKVSAYEFSTYGGLEAKVVDVSPDVLQDERGVAYFRVKLEASANGFGPDKPIVPGMTADVDIISGRQSILRSLLKPLFKLKENSLR